MNQREKLLSTIKDFDHSIKNLEKSVRRLRAMRAEVVKTYVSKYGILPKMTVKQAMKG